MQQQCVVFALLILWLVSKNKIWQEKETERERLLYLLNTTFKLPRKSEYLLCQQPTILPPQQWVWTLDYNIFKPPLTWTMKTIRKKQSVIQQYIPKYYLYYTRGETTHFIGGRNFRRVIRVRNIRHRKRVKDNLQYT